MAVKRYALGLDYGTNSCRSLVVDLDDGRELATFVYNYPTGEAGIVLDPRDPNLARQNPKDYVDGLVAVTRGALRRARLADRRVDPSRVGGIGVDTTGSTPIPVDSDGRPLAFRPEFRKNPNAMAWLWKDHTGHGEAAEITEKATRLRPQYLAKCGGTYSSEWFWSKVLHCSRSAPEVFRAAHTWVEHCDWMPALLAGDTRPEAIVRGVCAAGHKAMYSEEWDGLPDRQFLRAVDPALADLRGRLYAKAVSSDYLAGRLSAEWAGRLGLRAGIAIATGAFDAHMGAVGAGIREGTLVKILGTSTCDMMVRRNTRKLPDIPGVCGIVDGSILPGFYGIEAGQSAVGDIFLWFVNRLVPGCYGRTADEKFAALAAEASRLQPGAHGLLALDWNNGNRTILVDPRLTGLLVGQTLHTTAPEIYRALVEATAFGALTIVRRIEEYGVPVRDIVNCGGLATRNPMLMQIYADVTGRPMKVSRSDQTCALGAAIFGAVSAGRKEGGYDSVQAAQAVLCGTRDTIYRPDAKRHAMYGHLYELYRTLHDAFGTAEWSGRLDRVMKELLTIRDRQRGR
jgi:L-ribulokinase